MRRVLRRGPRRPPKLPLLTLSDGEIAAVAAAFADVMAARNYTCYGCAIMPDHVHVLIRKHRDKAETMIAQLQEASRAAVLAKPQAGRGADHPVWGGPGWKVYLETRTDMERVVKYICDNPLKLGRPDNIGPSCVPTTAGFRARCGSSKPYADVCPHADFPAPPG